MKVFRVIGLLFLVLLLSVTALAKKGPVPDKIYFDVTMQQDIGLRDVAEGKSDIFYFGVDYPLILGLDDALLNKLELYAIPSGYWSFIINPYPYEAPYYFELEGEEIFNPFAIREVRYALSFLLNRQYVVDEIQGGGGGPMFTVATPGQPGTYPYNLLPDKMGFTGEGDEERALAEIEAAMNQAAQLPENRGKLQKEGEWWTFNGEPVEIKFFIRVDDPTGRMRLGEYASQQIEKAGIKVERMLLDRSKFWGMVYAGNAEKWEYTIYTEGWGAGATRKWWEHILAQMYAPWWGYMPGGFGDGWKYKHEQLDQITQRAYNGQFLTIDEYWDLALTAQEIGIEEALRLYVTYQNQYFVANKARFNNRFAYGLGDGLTKYTLVTADTPDGIVRATQFSSRGNLFMSAWNPVGADGFGDVYSRYIAEPLYDAQAFESPASADILFNRAYPLDIHTDVSGDQEGNVVGHVEIPASALVYDPVEEKWVEIGPGKTAFTKGVYGLRLSNFHHGIPATLVDYLYSEAFAQEWATEDFEGDPYYDEGYGKKLGEADVTVAHEYDFANQQITHYFDYQFPPDESRVGFRGAPTLSTSANAGIGVVWEISEALARMVVGGGASGENYSFSQGIEGALEVDVIRPSTVVDIRAELIEMIAEQHVPVSIKDYVTPAEAVTRYQAAVDFIDQYGHAYISNGPFYISRLDYDANFVELTAFRDETYPFEPGYWMEQLRTTRLVVDRVGLPVMVEKGEQFMVTANVSEIIYPEVESSPATAGDVKVLLIAGEEELEFNAEAVKTGIFRAVIPADAIAGLESGSYTIVVIASAEGALPSTKTESIVIY